MPQDGIAIWHVVEQSALLSAPTLPSGVGAGDWGRSSIRMIRANGGTPVDDGKALWTAGAAKLAWLDGVPAFTVEIHRPAGVRITGVR